MFELVLTDLKKSFLLLFIFQGGTGSKLLPDRAVQVGDCVLSIYSGRNCVMRWTDDIIPVGRVWSIFCWEMDHTIRRLYFENAQGASLTPIWSQRRFQEGQAKEERPQSAAQLHVGVQLLRRRPT
jgi:hypothetical protein